MIYEIPHLALLGFGYLVLLFCIAYAADSGWIPARVVSHPLVYVLSLGVFASVWAYYASIGNAFRDGYGYLAQFIGISLAFLLSPLVLRPLLELTRAFHLGSLADLLTFRFRSPWAGTLCTLVILVGVTPIIALQIRAVADTASILSDGGSRGIVAGGFCLLLTLFAILFGTSLSDASQHSNRSRYDGLTLAIAFESLVKLIAFLAVGLFAVYGGFGGFEALDVWLQERPELTERLKGSEFFPSFHIMTLIFFTASVAMPHMYYVTFNENIDLKALSLASWGLPLFFLLLSLPVLPILWAGLHAESAVQVEYYPVIIGAAFDWPALSLLAYLGGLSAASGLIIVITLALANMCLNHLVMRVWQPSSKQDIYRWLLFHRRFLIAALIWAGFFFYYLPTNQTRMEVVSTIAFTAGLQFLPGIVAILYWPQANKKGFICGLVAGVTIWFLFLLLPLLMLSPFSLLALDWREVSAFSLFINTACFVLISLKTKMSTEERGAAEICGLDTIRRRRRSALVAKSSAEFVRSLTKPLGEIAARQEVSQALADLEINVDDRRPSSLRSLRGRLEANLSGLLGPAAAREIVDGYLPYSMITEQGGTDLNVIENRIEAYRSNLSGMAADLDHLRRYHRQILLDLPLGVCSLSNDGELVMWNRALEEFTSIAAEEIVGAHLSAIEEPWQSLLGNFLVEDKNHSFKQNFVLAGQKRTVNLHKAYIARDGDKDSSPEGVIILIEDVTETELLEAGLTHSERLASIGRLAASVAHEIGNPITGIACLAQTIRDEYPNDELNNLAEQIIEQTNRTSKILNSLVNFAHAGSSGENPEREIINIRKCMEQACTLVTLDRKSRHVELTMEAEGILKTVGDSQRLLQVLVNLINNARDASQPGGNIQVRAWAKPNRVVLSVSDEGIGISKAIRDRVFDPFFTTKEAGVGTGLGLALVFRIVEEMEGDIDIISPTNLAKGTGTSVVLEFPACYANSIADLERHGRDEPSVQIEPNEQFEPNEQINA